MIMQDADHIYYYWVVQRHAVHESFRCCTIAVPTLDKYVQRRTARRTRLRLQSAKHNTGYYDTAPA
jgi:hypothetical protein